MDPLKIARELLYLCLVQSCLHRRGEVLVLDIDVGHLLSF